MKQEGQQNTELDSKIKEQYEELVRMNEDKDKDEKEYNALIKKIEDEYAKTDFTCPGEYDSSEQYVNELFQFISENKDLSTEELMRKRQDLLIANGCEWALFNMHSEGVMDSKIEFAGEEFSPPTRNVYEETGVRSVFYPLSGQKAGEADEEIVFNFYLQGIWGKKLFTSRDVANVIADSEGVNNTHIIYKFEAPDEISKKPAFFFFTSYTPDKNTGYINMTKITQIGDDVYSITFSKKILDTEMEQNFEDWFEKNTDKYFKILDTKLPVDSLKTVFDMERETHKLIKKDSVY
ncbi:MAG: hypothetical protein V1690_00565 [Candidatus Moraniibacteriota bacterium]